MRSAAEATRVARVRNPDLLDHVDYRLAETPEEKEEIYHPSLPGISCAKARSCRPPSSVSPIDYDDAPNAWTFGVYLNGELYSSIRISVLTSEWRLSPSSNCSAIFFTRELDRGPDYHRSDAFRRRSRKGREVSRASLSHGAAGLSGRAAISTPISGLPSFVPNIRRSIARCSCRRPLCEPRLFPGLAEAGRIDGRAIFRRAGEGLSALSVHAFERVRAADAVPAPQRASFIASDAVKSPFDRASIVPHS